MHEVKVGIQTTGLSNGHAAVWQDIHLFPKSQVVILHQNSGAVESPALHQKEERLLCNAVVTALCRAYPQRALGIAERPVYKPANSSGSGKLDMFLGLDSVARFEYAIEAKKAVADVADSIPAIASALHGQATGEVGTALETKIGHFAGGACFGLVQSLTGLKTVTPGQSLPENFEADLWSALQGLENRPSILSVIDHEARHWSPLRSCEHKANEHDAQCRNIHAHATVVYIVLEAAQ